jgi:hypothetical protein
MKIERVENKKIKIFFEKIHNSLKTILKQSLNQSIELMMKKLIQSLKKIK